MSERIAAAFAAARDEGRAALMPYMMGGFPDHETSLAVADAYADAGADLVELGVPYADPLADGPVIHAAGTDGAARRGDARLGARDLRAARRPAPGRADGLREHGDRPRARALRARAGRRRRERRDRPRPAGRGGGRGRRGAARAGLALVPLVAPTTPPERRRRIAAAGDGFVYLVSDTRTTGERDELPESLSELIAATQADSPHPVAVGFGIGTPEQAAAVGEHADGVIVGSRLVRAVAEAGSAGDAAAAVSGFIADARSAMTAAR